MGAAAPTIGLATALATAAVFAVSALRTPTLWIERPLALWALVWLGLLAVASLRRERPAKPTRADAPMPPMPPGRPICAPVGGPQDASAEGGLRSRLGGLLVGLAIGLLGFAVCARLGWSTLGLSPGMHDEWSYLFQAKTFLLGRFWLPSQNAIPGLFDQIHVLNEGHFASRYFPGTGLWLAPFVALGISYPGQWLAAGLAAFLIHDTGRTLGGPRVGLVAGALVALSPGVAELCNALVAHAPTLLGLALFLAGFARARATATPARARFGWGLAAGVGLALAMLCRPLTAAAVGLPFGLLLVGEALTSLRVAAQPHAADPGPRARSAWTRAPLAARLLIATGLPLAAGLTFLAAHDHAITGSVWKTPYGLYNDLYTPRHVYGFANGTRGDAVEAPKRHVDYDRWARNLTWPGALRNGRARLKYSLRASVGTIPFAVGLIALTGALAAKRPPRRDDPREDPRAGAGPDPARGFWIACIGAIAVLHLAHLPYWFVGIHAYHYVFESIPLYALVVAGGVGAVEALGRRTHRPRLGPAFSLLALAPALWQWLPVDGPLQTGSGRALRQGSSFAPSRRQHQRFLDLVDARVEDRPALVLVKQPPRNFHLDYVVNEPTLDGPVLYGRFDPTRMKLEVIAEAFPDRALYLFDERSGRLERVPLDPAGRGPVSHPGPT
ncbi:MAG: glycosyltransferase family 39 protein [Deltaproteobacteria bacterium]|nr:glycosyltransferase family 39 protein [Deltaproteobacteria bacterium]